MRALAGFERTATEGLECRGPRLRGVELMA